VSGRDYYDRVFSLLEEHHKWFEGAIPLIASENIVSPAVKEAEICDFSHRYAEGWPGERVYAGCKYIDQVELLCIELVKKLFRCKHADVRPVSGVVANLAIYTAFTKPGDTMMARSIVSGGHISMGPLIGKKGTHIGGTAGAVHGLNVEYLALNYERMEVDIDRTVERIRKYKPRLIMLGASVFLFPDPVREIAEAAREVGAIVNYDAAHVAGLIAAGYFQDPLKEGADTVTFSTHKTLFGPQHGGIITDNDEHMEKIKKAVFPGVTSNHHLHNVAALAVAAAEFLEFGREYAGQIIKNAKALGQALYDLGFKVVAADRGFTESHTILVDISEHGDGAWAEKTLEDAGIIVNRNLLPWDIKMGRDFRKPGGIRLGTSEITRLGMKEDEMKDVARFIKRVIIDKEDPKKVVEDVREFRRDFQEVKYCFDPSKKAYEYIRIR